MCKDKIRALIVLYAPLHSNLIYNMITFKKKMFGHLTPPKGSRGV